MEYALGRTIHRAIEDSLKRKFRYGPDTEPDPESYWERVDGSYILRTDGTKIDVFPHLPYSLPFTLE